MEFRERLLATLRELQSVLEEPGVLVVGSEVPNLLQPNAASTLVVSQNVDLAVPVDRVAAIKARLRDIRGPLARGRAPGDAGSDCSPGTGRVAARAARRQ